MTTLADDIERLRAEATQLTEATGIDGFNNQSYRNLAELLINHAPEIIEAIRERDRLQAELANRQSIILEA